MMLNMSLLYQYMLRYISSKPSILKVSVSRGYLISSDALSGNIKMIDVIFSLYSVNVVYCINWFVCIEPSLHLRDKFDSIMFCLLDFI